MKQTAYIVSTNGELATARFKKSSACGDNCGMCNMCGSMKDRDSVVYNACGAKEGDMVTVTLETWKTILLAFITYIVPLILFFVVYSVTKNEIYSAMSLIPGFVLCSIFGNALAKRKSFMSKTEPLSCDADN